MKKLALYIIAATLGWAGVSCSNSDEYTPPIMPEQEQMVIYTEPLSADFGKFTQISVSGDQHWVIDARGFALMSGYENSTNYSNEDWLISPQIDLTQLKSAHFDFDHAGRYFTDITTDATVWISENYNGGLPSTANWKQLTMPIPFVSKTLWEFDNSGQISLTEYVGKKVTIAFKYLSSSKAGSLEIKNFRVSSGEAVLPVNIYGDGTRTKPYTVLGAINKKSGLAWVKGYIVGYLNPVDGTPVFTAENAKEKTNVIIADTTANIYLSNAIVVSLDNVVLQEAVSLGAKPQNLDKKLTVYGIIGSRYGLTNIAASYYILEDGTSGGTTPPVFSESFEKSLGDFVTYSVTGDEGWVYNSQFKAAYMTGFVNSQNRANEDWLISPQIDLTDRTTASLSFYHALRYNANPSTDATVWVSENYTSGAPSTATWNQLPTSFKDGTNWNFVNAGNISLNNYAGKKIRIALRYYSTTTKAGTWEVKNFVVE